MPPHCDSLDGPVVSAARRALEAGNVDLALPYVPADGEPEVRQSFDLAMKIRGLGAEAKELADLHFFETVVRIHRRGEDAPYTGLKPAGLDVGPAIPAAEKAIASGSADELIAVLADAMSDGVRRHMEHMEHCRRRRGEDLQAEREYVSAVLGFQVYSHRLYKQAQADSRSLSFQWAT